ncbi:hypothetical protein MTBUT4_440028 [Magnetospirillum sp. UT-4]|nr:hypothetical protein MTBUT4_440028 [Magnetospirillum sp. UT-4]
MRGQPGPLGGTARPPAGHRRPKQGLAALLQPGRRRPAPRRAHRQPQAPGPGRPAAAVAANPKRPGKTRQVRGSPDNPEIRHSRDGRRQRHPPYRPLHPAIAPTPDFAEFLQDVMLEESPPHGGVD